MPSCPLYKQLKSNGTTFYAFPGAAEDISAAYQNSNYKMYFSKYALLNFPTQNLSPGTQSKPIYFDFENSFRKSVNATPPSDFSSQIVESLRNYVANQEIVIRESRLNTNNYYYDTNVLETTSEKIFFKWCKSLNVIDFEPAIPQDEYFANLIDFQSNKVNDDSYFPEYLWKEREVIEWDTRYFYQSAEIEGKMEIEFNGLTNFRVGDTIRIFNVENSSIYNNGGALAGSGGYFYDSGSEEGQFVKILDISAPGATAGQRIVVDVDSTLSKEIEFTGQAELVYHRLVQYLGEINGVSNVQEANRAYTEVYAHIPDHTGMTPDILFRTNYDVNYKPNLIFPILPSQYQTEIVGAELFNSPIVNSPQNYPGSYFGHFDTLDFTYETSTGDVIRRSGDYFGVKGDINNPIVTPKTIDGISIDFDSRHYVKMNIVNRKVTNFDQFNALEVNNTPPNDFEFNAILWYYTVEDQNGISKTNIYGISFLDNPNNNDKEEEIGIKFPTYKKLVSNGKQDGSSYAFSLNLNFNIINDNPQDTYNPEAINSMFSMNLFNKAMQKLSSTNDSFLNILAEQSIVRDEINSIRGLIYTQTDINVINAKVKSLEDLIRLYSTRQMVDSNSVEVITSGTSIRLNSIDSNYVSINQIKASELYNAQGIIPMNIAVPKNKDFMINVINNDEIALKLQNNDRLTILLSRDLDYKQTVEFYITGTEFSSQNKQMDIYINSDITTTTSANTQVLLVGSIDLPVYYNTTKQLPNSALLWKDFKFDIDFEQPITLRNGGYLDVPLSGNSYLINNSIKQGDSLKMNNLFVGTSSVYDFSGQYKVDALVGSTSSYITLDITSNESFATYTTTNSSSLPMQIHGTNSSLLSNHPYFNLNKGKKILITRISESSTILSERYRVDVRDL
jgi:hypothetical protein